MILADTNIIIDFWRNPNCLNYSFMKCDGVIYYDCDYGLRRRKPARFVVREEVFRNKIVKYD